MSTTSIASPARPSAMVRARRDPLASRVWVGYALLAFALVPALRPPGPGQTAAIDVINVLALIAFAFVALAYRVPVRLPFLLPILAISVGSLIAMGNAASAGKAALTIVQDAYLYLWFVMLVEILRRRGDLRGLRLTWVVVANIVSVICVIQAVQDPQAHFPQGLLAPEGNRMFGTLYNPNMCADYLVLSVFVVLSLWRQASRAFLVSSLAVLGLAFLTTKSNGGLVSMLIGIAVLVALRARLKGRMPLLRLAGAACAVAGVALIGWWAYTGWGLGGQVTQLGQESFLARMSKSGADRGAIWGRLEESYRQSPLGIGPGNSTSQPVDVAHQQRAGTFVSKEPHSDYVGYAIERGPLAFLALLWLTVQALVFVARGRARVGERLGDPALGGLVVAALLGGLVASAVHSLVIEKLHFRHFWAFFALAVALCASTPAEDQEERDPRRLARPAS